MGDAAGQVAGGGGMSGNLAHKRALDHLRADPAMAKIIERVGVRKVVANQDIPHFEYFTRAIIYQQLAGKAAATIFGRFKDLFAGAGVAPAKLLGFPEEKLRGAGLSRQKLGYLRDLATKVANGEVDLDALTDLDDQEVIDTVRKVKGIGTWTAQMFLMFRMGRPDVLPTLDLGIQKAVQRAYRLRKHPTPARVAEIGARWRPHSTVACWYLWRSLDS
jgi:DNA-3-methyladenine glycosylase II